jgi:excisionase family DNA binding protein
MMSKQGTRRVAIPDPANLATIPAAAARYGVTPRTIYKWAEEGRFRLWKIGGATRVDVVEVDRAMIRAAS